VQGDGTVIMVHRAGSGIEELRMNLRTPDAHTIENVVVNGHLKTPRYGTKSTPRLSGQLYRGHARPPSSALASPPAAPSARPLTELRTRTTA
jgi:hypothetical protein